MFTRKVLGSFFFYKMLWNYLTYLPYIDFVPYVYFKQNTIYIYIDYTHTRCLLDIKHGMFWVDGSCNFPILCAHFLLTAYHAYTLIALNMQCLQDIFYCLPGLQITLKLQGPCGLLTYQVLLAHNDILGPLIFMKWWKQ